MHGGARARRSSGCRSAPRWRRRTGWRQRAGSEEHQGVVAEVAPYPYAGVAEVHGGRAAAGRRARRGHRPAQPGRGRAGGRVRRRRRARDHAPAVGGRDGGRVPRLGRRRRAPADRAGREPGPVPDRRRAGPGLWSYAAAAGAATAYHDRPTTATAPCSCSGRRGAACGRGCAPSCDQEVSIAARRPGRVAERVARRRRCCSSRRAGSAAMADELYILDGDNVAHVRGAGIRLRAGARAARGRRRRASPRRPGIDVVARLRRRAAAGARSAACGSSTPAARRPTR